jgi:diaminopimelate epimerase
MQFKKYQALGNDYLVVDEEEWGSKLSPEVFRRVCDRHRGVGSDGILIRLAGSAPRLRILNPDGSEAEKSGNGLRIFARYLWDQGHVGTEPFVVITPGGEVTCCLAGDGRSAIIDMGQARFESEAIPVLGPPRVVLRETMRVNGQELEFSAATIGNPHCVLIREAVSPFETQSLGPVIERDARFPKRTNVQFMQILDRRNLKIEIWERGAGYTLASGSSSCAAAAVARKLDLCDSAVTVHMPGGPLSIEINADFHIRMTGPVVHVADGRMSEEAFGG